MYKSLLSRGKVKTPNARTCIFENDALRAYRLVFTASVTEWRGLLSMSLPAPLLTNGN